MVRPWPSGICVVQTFAFMRSFCSTVLGRSRARLRPPHQLRSMLEEHITSGARRLLGAHGRRPCPNSPTFAKARRPPSRWARGGVPRGRRAARGPARTCGLAVLARRTARYAPARHTSAASAGYSSALVCSHPHAPLARGEAAVRTAGGCIAIAQWRPRTRGGASVAGFLVASSQLVRRALRFAPVGHCSKLFTVRSIRGTVPVGERRLLWQALSAPWLSTGWKTAWSGIGGLRLRLGLKLNPAPFDGCTARSHDRVGSCQLTSGAHESYRIPGWVFVCACIPRGRCECGWLSHS